MRESDLEADAEAIVTGARELCKEHGVPNVSGCCRECFRRAVEEYVARENPEMKRGEVFDLVQEWLLSSGERTH